VKSCLYVGRVRHRRFGATPHDFRLPLWMAYLDLGELDQVFRGRWLWSTTRPAWARFRRRDHLGDPDRPLDTCVRELVAGRSGCRPTGAVRLLTQLRVGGYGFDPVRFFYCFDREERLQAVVADVTNIPWKERHQYVLAVESAEASRGDWLRFRTSKELHVSPFLPMALDHAFTLRPPGSTLSVRIEDRDRDGTAVFDATLALRRRPITTSNLARTLLGGPWMPLQIVAAIYWQAFRLHRKGAPYTPHPALRARATAPEIPLE